MTHRQLISLWPKPSAKTLAADIGENYETVRKWRTRDSIPADRWLAVEQAARQRGLRVTLEQLARRKAAA